MSEISKAIDELLKEYVDPELRAAGFRKKRRRYSRELGDRVELVQVEASTWNRLDSGTFYVDLSIVIPKLALRLRNRRVELADAKGRESGIDTNIGFLLPEDRPRDWSVLTTGSNVEEGIRLKRALIDYGLPWFERARTDNGLMELLARMRSMDALELRAILYSDKHQYVEAQEMLDEIVRRRPDLSNSVVAWAEQRGIFGAK
ncbi:MAG: DUF4304 domain-containing protein [Nitrospira sp.]|nr:DUF4304 domain-containing protein [Nitrospira sp.]